jgi:hypothetical protein
MTTQCHSHTVFFVRPHTVNQWFKLKTLHAQLLCQLYDNTESATPPGGGFPFSCLMPLSCAACGLPLGLLALVSSKTLGSLAVLGTSYPKFNQRFQCYALSHTVDYRSIGLEVLTRNPEIWVPLFDQNWVDSSFAQTRAHLLYYVSISPVSPFWPLPRIVPRIHDAWEQRWSIVYPLDTHRWGKQHSEWWSDCCSSNRQTALFVLLTV